MKNNEYGKSQRNQKREMVSKTWMKMTGENITPRQNKAQGCNKEPIFIFQKPGYTWKKYLTDLFKRMENRDGHLEEIWSLWGLRDFSIFQIYNAWKIQSELYTEIRFNKINQNLGINQSIFNLLNLWHLLNI